MCLNKQESILNISARHELLEAPYPYSLQKRQQICLQNIFYPNMTIQDLGKFRKTILNSPYNEQEFGVKNVVTESVTFLCISSNILNFPVSSTSNKILYRYFEA